ncbi:MAG: FIG00544905: hypothetical protein [uncultured Acidimicrobiales bacterium]|uniref:Glycosyltransferase 2-like domain-containing protein n=1 Tax=uncultured Acidimicrobiales bacterium TaxID=310071 RepID=A0A6J4HQ77_9ACTN|nr:MAG: FIG00544905: hypothetical protein [uncultured Acidimicrobiales bacterium]
MLPPDEEASALDDAVNALRRRAPEMSADPTITHGQRRVLLGLLALVVVGLTLDVQATLVALISVAIVLYLAALVFRIELIRRALDAPPMMTVTDEEARSVEPEDLPVFTVLVPLYREPSVVPALLTALEAIEYPPDRLDVKILLEADDHETIAAMRHAPSSRVSSPLQLELLVVPPGEPRTKPKACNYGLAVARGTYLTIYDAEDRPDPLQLRRAAVVFRDHPAVTCLQARLSYYNPEQNLLTRWFTTEYSVWFQMLLPGLSALGAPIPLGGTSNLIRRETLEEVGAWDPFNVTEDADLGIRLHRTNRRVAILDSTTLEEANSDAINWVKQRSRWYKGYLQTWLVHLREPRRLWREVGPSGFVSFNLFVGGTPILTFLNPVFWFLTVLWFLDEPPWLARLFPIPMYYAALLCWLGGNLAVLYSNLVAVRDAKMPRLAVAVLASPIYWLLMSAAAVKAVVQLARAPAFWEKTTHGLGPPGSGESTP